MLQISEKPCWIGERPGTDARHRRRWSKAAGGLLKEDYVRLFGTTPNGSNEPTAGPKHTGDLAGSGSAINHIHEAKRGQYGVKPPGGYRQLLGAALDKFDITQTCRGRALTCQVDHLGANVDRSDISARHNQG